MKHSPPRRFKPAGAISWAIPVDEGPAFTKQPPRRKGVRAKGVRYENRVHLKMEDLYGERYLPSQWFKFGTEGNDIRWCQPDGLLFDVPNGVITVLEMKYNHTPNAWWQLRLLYGPLVQFVFPSFRIRVVEVCQWYDCNVAFPEPTVLTPSVDRCGDRDFHIHIYRPRRGDP